MECREVVDWENEMGRDRERSERTEGRREAKRSAPEEEGEANYRADLLSARVSAKMKVYTSGGTFSLLRAHLRLPTFR